MRKFTFFRQYDAMDCGPTCIQMVSKHYGKYYPLEKLREWSFLSKEGVSLLGISECAEKVGFKTIPVRVPVNKLVTKAHLPCILHWNQNHFVVLYKISSKLFYIADPAHGPLKLNQEAFANAWARENDEGIALLLEPTKEFWEKREESKGSRSFLFLYQYVRPYRKFILQLSVGMLLGSCISLLLPFLMKILVDIGINRKNLHFIHLILLSQLLLFVGSTAIDIIRNWTILHINTRINISLLSDFLIKLMKLPLNYFDTKLIGDIKQRISDHSRIQGFLTNNTLSVFFSFVNLIIFSFVLFIFSTKILAVHLVLSSIGIIWILLFLRRRKSLDYERFAKQSENENVLYELITGMQEIKLYGCETSKRWNWEKVQAKLFNLNLRSLALTQYQQLGASTINQARNIIISYLSAVEVVKGNITLGTMLSISYLIGQINGPIEQILRFVHVAQDAKLSFERLSEIHNKKNEENFNSNEQRIPISEMTNLDKGKEIRFSNASFQYEGPNSKFVLKNLNLCISPGQITAVVGTSGSGKTTLLKLLLKFYDPVNGKITWGADNMKDISPSSWRSKCGIVMQEGFIFNDTIAQNIALTGDKIDYNKLHHAISNANLTEFINDLPLGLNTRLGNTGMGISVGQKQRILIARAVYKNPDFLFFDEATSSLDANNEKVIMNNLNELFVGKTVVIIAHRLSTVKNADQIVVLEHGEIVESGRHAELISMKGKYFELIKNQLELGT